MTDNKKPSEPVEEERCAEIDREIEEFERQAERTEAEAERWARIEKKERAADILSTLSLVFSIIVLLIALAK